MTRILLVGCGKMGSAMLTGWLERGIAANDVVVVEPGNCAAQDAQVVADCQQIPADFRPDVVVLAVKPQMMADVAPAYARFDGAVFLSIAAGKTLAFFGGLLGAGTAIIRAMPNTPAAVRRGITVCVANDSVNDAQRACCQTLLEAVGEVAWIDDEDQMDAVTAVSGSGPAYVFLLAEVMAAAGTKAGLPADLAARLARATVAGSGELLRQSAHTAAQLRLNVTSPGGTTAAALAVLMADKDGLPDLMADAIAAATRRGRELAG